jgi:hypothetical protein
LISALVYVILIFLKNNIHTKEAKNNLLIVEKELEQHIKNAMAVRGMVQSQDRNQQNVITVKEMVKLDLAKGFLLFSRHVLSVMEMEKLLAKHAKNVVVKGKYKAMNQFQ